MNLNVKSTLTPLPTRKYWGYYTILMNIHICAVYYVLNKRCIKSVQDTYGHCIVTGQLTHLSFQGGGGPKEGRDCRWLMFSPGLAGGRVRCSLCCGMFFLSGVFCGSRHLRRESLSHRRRVCWNLPWLCTVWPGEGDAGFLLACCCTQAKSAT